MKKNSIIFLTIFFLISCGNLYAKEISTIIIDKFFQDGQKKCAKLGLGKYLLLDDPVKIIDISNDGVKDIILDTSKQRCEKSYSIFAGGTGGNDFIFFINPSKSIINSWSPSNISNYKEYNVFKMFIRNFKVINWQGQNALKIQLHGIACGVDGATGCYSIVSVSENGFKILQNPQPNPSYSLN